MQHNALPDNTRSHDHTCFSGFVASGPLVVLAEAALRMGSKPSYFQQMLLFQLVAGLTLAGDRLQLVIQP